MEKEVFEYLDRLRDSRVINMLGARPYIVEEFNIPKKEASELIMKWMKEK